MQNVDKVLPRLFLWQRGGGGCTLIFSHIRRLGLFFWFKF